MSKVKTPKVLCPMCGRGTLRKSPGKDGYVCSGPWNVCNAHVSGDWFRELAKQGK